MSRRNSAIDKEFSKLKRNPFFWIINFGGKEKGRHLHHKKQRSNGGDNRIENLGYIFGWIHTMYHHEKQRGECDRVWFRGRKPGLQKQIDDISDGLIANTRRKLFQKEVINDLKNRGR